MSLREMPPSGFTALPSASNTADVGSSSGTPSVEPVGITDWPIELRMPPPFFSDTSTVGSTCRA